MILAYAAIIVGGWLYSSLIIDGCLDSIGKGSVPFGIFWIANKI